MAKSADDPIEKIGVVGAGAMGHGIAQVAAMAGYQVELFDIDAAALKRALAAVRSNLDAGVERGVVDQSTREAALAALSTTTVLESAASQADLVIEVPLEAPADVGRERGPAARPTERSHPAWTS